MAPSPSSPLNYDELRARLGDDDELVADVIAAFLEDYHGRLEELQGALDARSWPRVKAGAHALKGALANLAADPAVALARELETSSAGGDAAASVALAGQLIAEVRRVAECLAAVGARS